MRKRRILLICAIAVGLALIAFVAYRPTPEPSYNGHPLSYWVALLAKPSAVGTEHEEATKAVDQIGVAALPFLVKWIQFNPPRWKITLVSGLVRTRFGPAKKLAGMFCDPTLANGAELSFRILGPRATPAFDELCRLMNDTNRPNGAISAARALACLGTNALPLFLVAVTNSHHPAHLVAFESISRIPDLGQTAQQVVPVVVTGLNPTNSLSDQTYAIQILAKFQTAPQTSVPALVSALQSTNSTVRLLSASTLGTFEAQAAAAIPALTNVAMADPDTYVRRYASNALYRIAPQSFPSPYGH